MHIGIDLDSTLVDYDALFWRLAMECGLLPEKTPPNKVSVREALRQQHSDVAWQRLQALAYGERMCEASLFDGAAETLRLWKSQGHEMVIVSHKSRYTAVLGKDGPDLHHYARLNLRHWGVDAIIPQARIFFCPSREEKCRLVSALGCQVFVDDLPEVFADSAFPSGVMRILFAPHHAGEEAVDAAFVCRHWDEVRAALDMAGTYA